MAAEGEEIPALETEGSAPVEQSEGSIESGSDSGSNDNNSGSDSGSNDNSAGNDSGSNDNVAGNDSAPTDNGSNTDLGLNNSEAAGVSVPAADGDSIGDAGNTDSNAAESADNGETAAANTIASMQATNSSSAEKTAEKAMDTTNPGTLVDKPNNPSIESSYGNGKETTTTTTEYEKDVDAGTSTTTTVVDKTTTVTDKSTLHKDTSSATTYRDGNYVVTEGKYVEDVKTEEKKTTTEITTTDEQVKDEIVKKAEEEEKKLKESGDTSKDITVKEVSTAYDLLDKDGNVVGDVTKYVGDLVLVDGQKFSVDTDSNGTKITYIDKDGKEQTIESSKNKELFSAIVSAAEKNAEIKVEYSLDGKNFTEAVGDLSFVDGQKFTIDQTTDKTGTKTTISYKDAAGETQTIEADTDLGKALLDTVKEYKTQTEYTLNGESITDAVGNLKFVDGQEFKVEYSSTTGNKSVSYIDPASKEVVYISETDNKALFDVLVSAVTKDVSWNENITYTIDGTEITVEESELIKDIEKLMFYVTLEDQQYTVKYKDTDGGVHTLGDGTLKNKMIQAAQGKFTPGGGTLIGEHDEEDLLEFADKHEAGTYREYVQDSSGNIIGEKVIHVQKDSATGSVHVSSKTWIYSGNPYGVTYGDDSNLSALRSLVGEYGVVAQSMSTAESETNFRIGLLTSATQQIGQTGDKLFIGSSTGVGSKITIEDIASDVSSMCVKGVTTEVIIENANASVVKDGDAYIVTIHHEDGTTTKTKFESENKEFVVRCIAPGAERQTVSEVREEAKNLAAKLAATAADKGTTITVGSDQRIHINTQNVSATSECAYDVVHIDAGAARNQYGNNSYLTFKLDDESTYIVDQNGWLNFDAKNNQVIVVNIDTSGLNSADTIDLTQFYFGGNASGNMDHTADSQRIVFNFGSYNGTLKIVGAFAGFIIAPDANVEVANTINGGQTICSNLKLTGIEFHNSGYTESSSSAAAWRVYDVSNVAQLKVSKQQAGSVKIRKTNSERAEVSINRKDTKSAEVSIGRRDYGRAEVAIDRLDTGRANVSIQRNDKLQGEVSIRQLLTRHGEASIDKKFKVVLERTERKSEKGRWKERRSERRPGEGDPNTNTNTNTDTDTGTDTDTNTNTDTDAGGEVLGATRDREQGGDGGKVLGATRGRGTGDEGNIAGSLLAMLSSGGLLGLGAKRRSRRDRKK